MAQTGPEGSILESAIVPTFFRYAGPSVAGLLAITSATLVDGYFVGNYVGAEALAAITLLIPYFTFLFGIALMLAVGGTVSAGRYLGGGQMEQASAIFSKTLIAVVCISVTAMLVTGLFPEWLFRLLGAPAELHPLMLEYFSIISGVLIIQLTAMALYYFIRADERPYLATTGLVCGAVANILLDALFVGYWQWGLTGAAWATGLAQLLQLGILLHYFRGKTRRLRFGLRQREWRSLVRTAFNGVSEFINELSVGLVIFLLNWLLIARQGVEGVAAFTVVNYLIFLSLMLFYGIADAIHLLVSQNYGAGNGRRIGQFMKTAVVVVMGLSTGLLLALMLAGEQLTGLFLSPDERLARELAVEYVGVLWPLFLVNGLNVLLSVYLTAMHLPLPSALVALSRSLILPVALLLAIATWFPGMPLVAALPLAEWLTFLLALALFWRFQPARLIRPAAES